MKLASFLTNAVLLVGVVAIVYYAPDTSDDRFEGRVKWVTDGDTFLVEGHDYPIRLWGIDAPERDTIDGVASGAFLRGRIMGKTVSCEVHVVDKYRRSVATCDLGDEDIALMMLLADQAVEYCSFTRNEYGFC